MTSRSPLAEREREQCLQALQEHTDTCATCRKRPREQCSVAQMMGQSMRVNVSAAELASFGIVLDAGAEASQHP